MLSRLRENRMNGPCPQEMYRSQGDCTNAWKIPGTVCTQRCFISREPGGKEAEECGGPALQDAVVQRAPDPPDLSKGPLTLPTAACWVSTPGHPQRGPPAAPPALIGCQEINNKTPTRLARQHMQLLGSETIALLNNSSTRNRGGVTRQGMIKCQMNY